MTIREQYTEALRMYRLYAIGSNPNWHNIRRENPISDDVMEAAHLTDNTTMLTFKGTLTHRGQMTNSILQSIRDGEQWHKPAWLIKYLI